MPLERDWVRNAIEAIRSEQHAVGETPLVQVPLRNADGIKLYLKDESAHPSGSLKHRLARSLYLHALCSGHIGPTTTIVEASSGSTAISAAYFARLLGLEFVAVVPVSTSQQKVEAIGRYGGRCHMVAGAREMRAAAIQLARETGGYNLDQFTLAERATDWRSGNIAQSIFDQSRAASRAFPDWIVCGAGTGGTATTIGRFIRYGGYGTRLCVADPTKSVFHRHHADRNITTVDGEMSCVEGIGRPEVAASFIADVIDRMITVEDAASMSAARHLSRAMGRLCGPSTGTNLHACLLLIDEMMRGGRTGTIVSLICDGGDRYASTCFDDNWLESRGITCSDDGDRLSRFLPIGGREASGADKIAALDGRASAT